MAGNQRRSKRPFLLRIWYSIVVIILVALLYEHTLNLQTGRLLFWVRLLLLAAVLVMTILVVEDIFRPQKEVKRVENLLGKELRRKSREIRKLKEEKNMFFKSALRRSEENVELKRKKE